MLLRNIHHLPKSCVLLLVLCVVCASADTSWFANLFKHRSIQDNFNSFFAVEKVIECNIPNQLTKGFCTESEKCTAYGKLFNTTSISRLSFVKQLNCDQVSDKSQICCPNNNGNYE